MYSVAHFKILVDGKSSSPVYPERGIRQDDHNSPYIFIICADYLNQYIHFASIQPKSDIGIKLHKNYPNTR